jgi:hypothetical protein
MEQRVIRAFGFGLAVTLAAASTLRGQTPPQRTAEQMQASYAAHKGEFDYLLGDWEFTATSQQYGTFHGLWSAVRLDEGQILDEYRVVGDEGETYHVTTTLRNWNGALDRWELIGANGGTGLQDFGTGHWDGKEMKISQTFGVAAQTPSTWRIRYYDIAPDRFSWAADRSTDGGKTWVTNFQQLQAKRIGAQRSLPALTTVQARAAVAPRP